MTERVERGCFITFEGGEGSGKSTQARLLASRLEARGHEVILTREPGGTPAAEAIRRLLVNGDVDRWQPMTEALLHTAARVEHVNQTIIPALERGFWVVCDRFSDSTRAYQGITQGLGIDTVDELQALAVGDLSPDLTIILDLPPDVALARARMRLRGQSADAEDRYERMGTGFHRRLRDAFLDIARANPGRCEVIDGARSQEEIAGQVWARVGSALLV